MDLRNLHDLASISNYRRLFTDKTLLHSPHIIRLLINVYITVNRLTSKLQYK